MKQDMIVILDLGSHENTVVARAIRALGVYSEIYPHDITAAELKALPGVKGVIINGGPNNVVDGVEIDVLPEIYEAGLPVIAAGHAKAQCEVKMEQFKDDEEAIKAALKSFVLSIYSWKFILSASTATSPSTDTCCNVPRPVFLQTLPEYLSSRKACTENFVELTNSKRPSFICVDIGIWYFTISCALTSPPRTNIPSSRINILQNVFIA